MPHRTSTSSYTHTHWHPPTHYSHTHTHARYTQRAPIATRSNAQPGKPLQTPQLSSIIIGVSKMPHLSVISIMSSLFEIHFKFTQYVAVSLCQRQHRVCKCGGRRFVWRMPVSGAPSRTAGVDMHPCNASVDFTFHIVEWIVPGPADPE